MAKNVQLTRDFLTKYQSDGGIDTFLKNANMVPYCGISNSYGLDGLCIEAVSNNETVRYYEAHPVRALNAALAFIREWGFAPPAHWLPRVQGDYFSFERKHYTGKIEA